MPSSSRAVADDLSTPVGTRVRYAELTEDEYCPEYFGRVGIIARQAGSDDTMYWVDFPSQERSGETTRICFYPPELRMAECSGVIEARERREAEHAGSSDRSITGS